MCPAGDDNKSGSLKLFDLERYLLAIRRVLGSRQVREARKTDVSRFLGLHLSSGIESRSVARKLTSLRQFFRLLLLDRVITKDPDRNDTRAKVLQEIAPTGKSPVRLSQLACVESVGVCNFRGIDKGGRASEYCGHTLAEHKNDVGGSQT